MSRSTSAANVRAVYVPGVIANDTGRNDGAGLFNVVLYPPERTLFGAYTLPNIRGIVADNSTHCEMPSQSLDERLTEKSVQLAELGVRYLLLILNNLVASILSVFIFIMYIERRKCKVDKNFSFYCSTTAFEEKTRISCAKNR